MKKIIILFLMAMIIIMPLAGAVNITKSNKDNANILVENVSSGDFTHTVLVESISSTTCPYCPSASSQLYSIYNSNDYDFYYATIVSNKIGELPLLARTRLSNRLSELGIKYVPDVHFDGGYKNFVGEQEDEQPYKDAMNQSGERTVPDIDVDVDVEWKGSGTINIEVTVQNNELEEYNGHLRVYITEIESRWNDQQSHPYHFAVLDIPIDKKLTMQRSLSLQRSKPRTLGDTYTFTKTWTGDITKDNSMVIASVFDKDTDYAVQTASAEPVDTSSDDISIIPDGYTDITVQEAWEMLNDPSPSNGIQIPVDVRNDEEWNEERIKTPAPENPRFHCLADLQDENKLQEFMSLYNGNEIILYCKTGGRSATAASILVDNGFTGTIYNMLGGITAWKDAGYPTPKPYSHHHSSLISHPVFLKFLDLFPNEFPILRHLLGL